MRIYLEVWHHSCTSDLYLLLASDQQTATSVLKPRLAWVFHVAPQPSPVPSTGGHCPARRLHDQEAGGAGGSCPPLDVTTPTDKVPGHVWFERCLLLPLPAARTCFQATVASCLAVSTCVLMKLSQRIPGLDSAKLRRCGRAGSLKVSPRGAGDCFSLIRVFSCLARHPTLESRRPHGKIEVGFLLFAAYLSLLFFL